MICIESISPKYKGTESTVCWLAYVTRVRCRIDGVLVSVRDSSAVEPHRWRID